jgi:hypothetical protein
MAMTMVAAQAAPPAAPDSQRVIGTAVSPGSFLMNNRLMAGSGSVQNGAALATRSTGSTLHLEGGVRLDLAPNSRGRVYQDRLVLEQGEAAIEGAYRVDTSELRVEPSAGATSAVGYQADGRLKVSAVSGPVRVANHAGLLLASVTPGRSVLLSPKANNAPNTMSLVGTIEKRENGLFLQDETAGITVRLQGTELDKFVGRKVRISGRTDEQAPRLEGVAATVVVASVQPVGGAKKKAAAGAAAGGAAAAGGLSTTAVVVGGIVVAGAVTGTTVAVNRSGRSTTAQSLGPQTISQ